MKVVKELQAILCGCEQFVLTGSTVVQLQGLTGESKDIDITLVKPTDATVEILRNLQKQFPYKGRESKKMFILDYHGFKVDIFITEVVPYDEKLNYDGIIISSIKQIVDVKKSYRRLKDLLQLRAWSMTIYSSATLFTDLTTIQLTEDYEA